VQLLLTGDSAFQQMTKRLPKLWLLFCSIMPLQLARLFLGTQRFVVFKQQYSLDNT